MSLTFAEGEAKRLDVALTPIPIEPASLEGIVTDANTQQGIAGVLVQIVELGSTTTSSDGTYSIVGIPPGSYTVRFSHPDYQTAEY